MQAVEAAVHAAENRRNAPLRVRVKGVRHDVVTEADKAAEDAAAEVIRGHRPDDGILGEEGTDTAGRRRWLIDGIDGTVAFANRMTGGWSSAVALEDDLGPKAAAVIDPYTREMHAADRDTRAGTVRAPVALIDAHVATFLRRDRLVLPGVEQVAHRLMSATGLLLQGGSGTLQLAWVAAGRLDAWIQPVVDPWDWVPGALLVTQAGGTARIVEAQTRWHIAGPRELVDELEALALG